MQEMLKTSGLLWAGAAGLHLFNAHRGTEPKQPAYGSAAIAGVLAVLSLTKGFN